METSKPPDNAGNLYLRLLRCVLPYKLAFAAGILGMLAVAAGDTGFAWILQPLMDKGFVERDMDYIRWMPALLILIALARAVGDFVDTYCMSWVSRMVVQDLRQKMFERLIYAPTGYYDVHSSGGLVSRLTYDVEQVAQASTGAFRMLVRDSLKAMFLLGLMFYLNWKLSLIFLVLFPIAFVVLKLTSSRFRKISSHIQESVGDITHIARQAFQGHRLVKIFDAYDRERSTFFAANKKNRQQYMKKAAVLAGSVPLLVFLMGTGVAVVIWLALLLETRPGVFMSYLVAMTMFIRPVKSLSRVNEVIQTGLAGAESVFRTIDMAVEEDRGAVRLQDISSDVSFRNVCFNYQDADTVLDDISFDIPAGATVALVGPSGSGKTTIASILLRFYSPTSGEVRIDGHLLHDINLASLRGAAAIVSQEVVLFDDTIRNNIAYGGAGEIDEARLRAAAGAACCMEFVDDFEDGFETRVGESGTRLSGGQRQRIAIARALYKDAPLLILDEATSSLDSGSEKRIQQAIDNLVRNRTTLVIAHRLSTIENADLILVLDKGRIVERGAHRELLEREGAYFQLYTNQYSAAADAGHAE